jgi:hypothetical protein
MPCIICTELLKYKYKTIKDSIIRMKILPVVAPKTQVPAYHSGNDDNSKTWITEFQCSVPDLMFCQMLLQFLAVCLVKHSPGSNANLRFGAGLI